MVKIAPPPRTHYALVTAALLATLAGLLLKSGAAQAQTTFQPQVECEFVKTNDANPTMNFGTYTGGVNTATGTWRIRCRQANTGGTIKIPPVKAKICLGLGTGTGGGSGNQRRMKNGNNNFLYQIYKNENHSGVVGQAITTNSPSVVVENLYLLWSEFPLTVYGKTTQTGSVASGLYSSDFSGADLVIRYIGYTGTEPACAPGAMTKTLTNGTLTARVNAQTSCTLGTVTDIDFGITETPNTAVVTGSVTVTCSKDLKYSIGANGGNYGTATGSTRYMQRGSDTATNKRIRYRLCRDEACTDIWLNSPQARRIPGTGTGSATTHPFYAQVRAAENANFNGASGTYTDKVVVTVFY